MSEIKYSIDEEIAVLSSKSNGWTKELNLVSWNERAAKYDIREWSADHEKMGKGVTLDREELHTLYMALRKIFSNGSLMLTDEEKALLED